MDTQDGDATYQVIRFVRRRGLNGDPLDVSKRQAGILTQELLRVAIDRTLYLYAEAPCAEDTAIIEHLREALRLYESRASRRTIEKMAKPELAETCQVCGHILCSHQKNLETQ